MISFGFISKQHEITGTNPDDRDNDEGDIPPDAPISPTPSITNYQPPAGNDEYTNFQLTEKLREIISILENNPNSITNASLIANKVGVSKPNAQRYLFELLKQKRNQKGHISRLEKFCLFTCLFT